MDAIAEVVGVPTVDDVDRIIGMPDPVVRNLGITQCYHELAPAMSRRLAGNANWCAFATWASKKAGRTIRGEDLEKSFTSAIERSPVVAQLVPFLADRLHSLGASIGDDQALSVVIRELDLPGIAARAGDAVARGNLKVFEEIGLAFARYLATASLASGGTSGLSAFLDHLRDGDPPDGQRLLRSAFAHYHEALGTSDAAARAELCLLANLEIGLHEQTRLQPEIREALDAAVPDPEELTERLVIAVAPRRATLIGRVRSAIRRLLAGPTPLERAVAPLVEQIRRELRMVITDRLMTLSFADGRPLRLGADLRNRFPRTLERLRHPGLIALLSSIDPTPDSVAGSGARDWGDLPDRMHYIADLFRCMHEDPALFSPPFKPEQVTAIRAGTMPAGAL